LGVVGVALGVAGMIAYAVMQVPTLRQSLCECYLKSATLKCLL
jgi:hypothetical protein